MSEKVLNEFSQRINRAKTLLETTKNQCSSLKKEAMKLEKEYEGLQNEKKNAEVMEESLKNQYIATKTNNDQESQKNARESEDLNQLRELQRKLKRESEICKADYSKNSLMLQELVNERKNLERLAQQFSDQLEQVNLEKRTLQEEHEANQAKIQQYSVGINDIKRDVKNMREMISTSFGSNFRGTPQRESYRE